MRVGRNNLHFLLHTYLNLLLSLGKPRICLTGIDFLLLQEVFSFHFFLLLEIFLFLCVYLTASTFLPHALFATVTLLHCELKFSVRHPFLFLYSPSTLCPHFRFTFHLFASLLPLWHSFVSWRCFSPDTFSAATDFSFSRTNRHPVQCNLDRPEALNSERKGYRRFEIWVGVRGAHRGCLHDFPAQFFSSYPFPLFPFLLTNLLLLSLLFI